MVSIRASQHRHPWLEVRHKFIFEDHVRVWHCFSCLSGNWYFKLGEAGICGHLCVTLLLLCNCSPILEYYSPVWWSAAECHLQLLERQELSRHRPDQSSCHCLIGVMLLGYVCCTRSIRTKVSVCSVSLGLLLPEFDILEPLPQLIHWSLGYRGVELPNLQAVSCRSRFECGMTIPTLCLPPER